MNHFVTPKNNGPWLFGSIIGPWLCLFLSSLVRDFSSPIQSPPLRGKRWQKFCVGNIRCWHLFFGVLLTFLFLWRIYLAFFSRFKADWADFFAFLHIPNLVRQIKFYLLIEKEGPPHRGLYGPMQSVAYLGRLCHGIFHRPYGASSSWGRGITQGSRDLFIVYYSPSGGGWAGLLWLDISTIS